MPSSNRVFVIEEIGRPHFSHHHAFKRPHVVGEATPKRFYEAVVQAYNRSLHTGNGEVIYEATPRGRKLNKLFQAKNNQGDMFSTFHSPAGKLWKIRAKVPAFFEKAPHADYSSAV